MMLALSFFLFEIDLCFAHRYAISDAGSRGSGLTGTRIANGSAALQPDGKGPRTAGPGAGVAILRRVGTAAARLPRRAPFGTTEGGTGFFVRGRSALKKKSGFFLFN